MGEDPPTTGAAERTSAGQKLRSFRALPLFARLWMPAIWIMLGLGRLVVLFVPFRRLAPRLGRPWGTSSYIPLLDDRQRSRALSIGRAVKTAAKYTPWTSNCFPQAIAGRAMLGLYNIPHTIFFGLRRQEHANQPDAHAWIAAGPVRVTGGNGFAAFTVVQCYVNIED